MMYFKCSGFIFYRYKVNIFFLNFFNCIVEKEGERREGMSCQEGEGKKGDDWEGKDRERKGKIGKQVGWKVMGRDGSSFYYFGGEIEVTDLRVKRVKWLKESEIFFKNFFFRIQIFFFN